MVLMAVLLGSSQCRGRVQQDQQRQNMGENPHGDAGF